MNRPGYIPDGSRRRGMRRIGGRGVSVRASLPALNFTIDAHPASSPCAPDGGQVIHGSPRTAQKAKALNDSLCRVSGQQASFIVWQGLQAVTYFFSRVCAQNARLIRGEMGRRQGIPNAIASVSLCSAHHTPSSMAYVFKCCRIAIPPIAISQSSHACESSVGGFGNVPKIFWQNQRA